MATNVIGNSRFSYTSESDVSYQILYNRSGELHDAIEAANAGNRVEAERALVNTVLGDYDWDRDSGWDRVGRVENAVRQLMGVYGRDSWRTSENDICRHILAHHSEDIKSAGLVQTVMQEYGWQNNCALSRYFQKDRIQSAIQLALTSLKVRNFSAACKRAAQGEQLSSDEFTVFTDEELRVMSTAPKCFHHIAMMSQQVRKGSFSDRMKKWEKTVQSVDRSTPFYRREIARAHQHLTKGQLDAGQVFARVKPYIPKYPRAERSPEDLLEGSPLADHMIEEIERDMEPAPVTDPFVAFEKCHLEDIFIAYQQYIRNRTTEKRDLAAFHSFVNCIKKGKKDPDVLFERFEPSLRKMFGHIHDPEDFITAVLEHRPSYTEEIADLRDQKRIVIWLYMRIHGINDIPTGESITEAFEAHFRYFEHRGRIVDRSAHTDEYISRSLEPLMKELQDPEFLRGTNEGLRRLMAANKTVELDFPSFTDRVFHVPEIVFKDFERGAPQLRLTDGKSTTFEGLPPDSSGELSERRDVMEFVGGISAFCTDFAQRRGLDEPLRQDLFRNIMFLESQTVRNRSGTGLHLGISPQKMFSEWNSSISSAESDSINVEWNEREGCFDVTLKQSFAVRMHESSVEAQELRPTGLLTISTHFQLIPARDHWDWEGPEFRPKEIQFQPLYRDSATM